MQTARRIRMPALAALTLAALGAGGEPCDGPFPWATPDDAGMSAEGLEAARAVLEKHVASGDIAGAVAGVVRDGHLVRLDAVGEIKPGVPMPCDALFRVYSMTRPVTSLAILRLQDQGRLTVRDPVHHHLQGFHESMTLAHLLTHTSGLGSRNAPLYRDHDVHGWDRSLAEVVARLAPLPLFEAPGTRFRYGLHAEVLGRVIEVVTGRTLDVALAELVLEPLGMHDATFRVDPAARHRLPDVRRREDGRLVPHEMESIPVTGERALTSAGVGLVASTSDFLRFGQFVLEAGGALHENAVPDELLPLGAGGYWAGSGWSLGGMAVVLDPGAYPHPITPGTVWWDGSAGTRFWVDPTEGLVVVVMAQVSPAGGGGFREAFMGRVHDALEERRATGPMR